MEEDKNKKRILEMLLEMSGQKDNKFFGVSINFDINTPATPMPFNMLNYVQSVFCSITKDNFIEGDRQILGGCHVVRFLLKRSIKENANMKDVFIGDVYGKILENFFINESINNDIIKNKVSSIIFVEKLMIKNEYRGTGLSHKVIKEIVDTFAEDDETLVILHPEPSQQSFYDKNNTLHSAIPKEGLNNLFSDFGLQKFDTDEEFSKYKLYSLCKSYGFEKLGNTDLFYYHSANENKILDNFDLENYKKE